MKPPLLALLLSLALALPAAAQPLEIIRGTVAKVEPSRLTVTTAGNKPVVVGLASNWRLAVTKPIRVADIKPGSFIGSAEMPQPDGRGKSLEVHVFPPGVKVGEGHYAWDKKPGSMMTNGTVGKIELARGGRELEVVYPTGVRRVVVTRNIPIVQITDGDKSQLKRGAQVFIIAGRGADGQLVTSSVTTGVNGAKPPM